MITKQDRETLTESQRITLTAYYSDASLARFRAAKHRKAGRELQADIQDEIAVENDLAALRYRQLLARQSA